MIYRVKWLQNTEDISTCAQASILTVGLTLQRDDARIAARAQMEVGQEIVGQIIVAHFVEAHVRLIQMHLWPTQRISEAQFFADHFRMVLRPSIGAHQRILSIVAFDFQHVVQLRFGLRRFFIRVVVCHNFCVGDVKTIPFVREIWTMWCAIANVMIVWYASACIAFEAI